VAVPTQIVSGCRRRWLPCGAIEVGPYGSFCQPLAGSAFVKARIGSGEAHGLSASITLRPFINRIRQHRLSSSLPRLLLNTRPSAANVRASSSPDGQTLSDWNLRTAAIVCVPHGHQVRRLSSLRHLETLWPAVLQATSTGSVMCCGLLPCRWSLAAPSRSHLFRLNGTFSRGPHWSPGSCAIRRSIHAQICSR